jgi:hypothetical protein
MNARYIVRAAALAAVTAALLKSAPVKAYECYNDHICLTGGCWYHASDPDTHGHACYIIGGSCSFETGTCPTGS